MHQPWKETVGQPSYLAHETWNDEELTTPESLEEGSGYELGGHHPGIAGDFTGFIGFGFLFLRQLGCVGVGGAEDPNVDTVGFHLISQALGQSHQGEL